MIAAERERRESPREKKDLKKKRSHTVSGKYQASIDIGQVSATFTDICPILGLIPDRYLTDTNPDS
jgi:predicted metal-dependent RNase